MFERCCKHPVVPMDTNGDPIDRDLSSETLGGGKRSRRL